MAWGWALFAVLLGCAALYRFAGLESGWAGVLLIFGAGSALGIGFTSCLFFLCRVAFPGAPTLSLFVEVAVFVWLAYGSWRRRRRWAIRFPDHLLLAGVLALAAAVVAGGLSIAWQANPQGNWDAWAMWNLRARFLAAGGELQQRAWSPAIATLHPDYPLLVPAFVARCWTFAGSTGNAAPIATSSLFFASLLSISAGGVATWRGRSLGLLLGLAVLGSPMLLHEVWAEYADIPAACYFTGAIVFSLLNRPFLAGLLAGLAAWTKDEGVLFLIVFLAAQALLRQPQLRRAIAGAIPGAAVALFYKLALAPAGPMYLRQNLLAMMQRAIEPGRCSVIVSAFMHQFGAMAIGYYHPLLPVVALAAALRFDPQQRRELLFAAIIPAAMLAGYFGTFLITPYPLKWQLETSLSRLISQIWPSLLVAIFGAIRAPESMK
jgi:hypothetical protein